MRNYVVMVRENTPVQVRAYNTLDAAEKATGTLLDGPDAVRVTSVSRYGHPSVLMSDGRTVVVVAH